MDDRQGSYGLSCDVVITMVEDRVSAYEEQMINDDDAAADDDDDDDDELTMMNQG